MNDILLTQIMQILIPILASILTAIFGAVGIAARRYLGERATAILREALHEAFDRALAKAAQDGSNSPEMDAVAYIEATMGDTVKRLKASTGGLLKRAQAQMAEMGGQNTARFVRPPSE